MRTLSHSWVEAETGPWENLAPTHLDEPGLKFPQRYSPEQEPGQSLRSQNGLAPFFNPRTVAVVGASPTPGKPGHILLRNLMEAGELERLYPVNPGHRSVLGLSCYPSVSSIQKPVDLVVVALPSRFVPAVVRDCVEADVPGVVVISSGFSELGSEEGRLLEAELGDIISGTRTRLLGPNTLGYYLPERNLDLLFLGKDTFKRPGPGGIALVSQSGSLGVDFMEELVQTGTGISLFLGLGNKLDICESAVLEFLKSDQKTHCVALYLENISQGARFLRLGRELSRHKPLILLKGGRSPGGSKAACLHTGRLGGSHRVLQGVMEQAGILEAGDEEELMDLARVFSCGQTPKGNRVLVLTNGGGNGIVAADLLEASSEGLGQQSLELVEIPEKRRKELRRLLPDFITPGNPLDLGSQAGGQEYLEALKFTCDTGLCDLVLLGLTPSDRLDVSIARDIGELAEERNMPVVVYLKGNTLRQELTQEFSAHSIPAYPSIRPAVLAARALVKWHLERDSRDGDDQ